MRACLAFSFVMIPLWTRQLQFVRGGCRRHIRRRGVRLGPTARFIPVLFATRFATGTALSVNLAGV